MSLAFPLKESFKSRRLEHALNLFQRMQEGSVQPDRESFLALLKTCVELKCIDKGRIVHAEVTKVGLDKDRFFGGTLLDMYVKLGCLGEAIEIFDKLEAHDVVSWTTLITGYAESGSTDETWGCLRHMQLEGVFPNAITYACSLKGCIGAVATEKGFKLHAEIAADGYEMDLLVGTSLVDLYGKSGLLSDAEGVFDDLTFRNVVTWNALLSGYTKHQFGERVLEKFEKLEAQGVSPDAFTYICVLKGCGIIQAIETGQRIYSATVKKGFETDYKVLSIVVDLYGKCGLYLEARSVFFCFSIHDTVLWNTLLAGYVGNGLGEEALELLLQMDCEGVPADKATLVLSMRACGSTRNLHEGHKVYMMALKKGYESESSFCNTLIGMYMNCGSVVDAQKVFDELPLKDAVTWTALMVGFSELGLADKALICLEQMQAPLDNVALLCGLKACCLTGNLNRGKELHVSITEEGHEKDLYIGNTLVDMYARCGLLLEAQGVIDELPVIDVGSWNAFISGCIEIGRFEEALQALQRMLCMEIPPNSSTYICSLKCSVVNGNFEAAKEIPIEVFKKGLENDAFVANSIIEMYIKFDSLTEADCIVSKLKVEDVVPWNAMIVGYAEYGLAKEALGCIESLRIEGPPPNEITYLSGLRVCSNVEDCDYGQLIYSDMIKKGFLNHFHLESTLVDFYVKCNRFLEAFAVFDSMPVHDVVSWTALITGYASIGSVEEASYCLERMLAEGVYPNDVTYLSMLKACSSIRDKSWGRKIHAEIVIDGYEEESFVSATLVDMYAKCGMLVEARELLLELKVVEPTSWTALIAGYTEHGLAIDSLRFLQQMEGAGVHASSVTFICCLKSCGSTAALCKGRELHGKIVNEGLDCDLLIGSSITDMYAKCGCLQEASSIFQGLLVKDVVSWNSLLAGYACQGESHLVFLLLERMQRLGTQPDKSTLLSVFFACSHAGLIDEGHELVSLVNEVYNVSVEHLNCLIDLLTRAGQFFEAWVLMESMPFQPELVSWSTMLSVLHKWDKSGEVARQAFEYAVKFGRKHVLSFQQTYRTFL